MSRSLVLVLLLLVIHPASAEIEALLVWQPNEGDIRYLIPKRTGEAPSQFTEKWQASLKADRRYGRMENTQKLNLPTAGNLYSMVPTSTETKPNVAVILNRPNQMYVPDQKKPTYLQTAIRSFEAEGANLLAVPIGLENVLSPADMEDFRKRLNKFDGQLGVGGDDPHPLTYGSKTLKGTAGDLNFKRDIEQSAYIQEYLANGKGRVFYICGSMQRAAIADGHGFFADIGGLTNIRQRKERNTKLIEVVADPDSELAIAAGTTRFRTTNFHHAAVNPHEAQPGKRPQTKVTAYNINPDGTRGAVVKAIEFPENRGFATQFHPEFRGSPEESRIVRYVATGWKMRGRYAPKDIVACMENELQAMMSAFSGMAP